MLIESRGNRSSLSLIEMMSSLCIFMCSFKHFLFLQKPITLFRLADCKVTEEWVEHLAFGLTFPFSPLRHLDLSNNDLKDSGVELLCKGLSNQCCRLKTLRYMFKIPCHFTNRWTTHQTSCKLQLNSVHRKCSLDSLRFFCLNF